MKRLITFLGLLILCPTIAVADGSAVTGICANYVNGEVRTVTISWTGDDSTGAVPTKALSAITCSNGETASAHVMGYWLCGGETSSVVAKRPTDDYDIALSSGYGDIMGNALNNRDSNATEYGGPTVTDGNSTPVSRPSCRFVDTDLTFALTGNEAASAQGVVRFYFLKRPF